MRNTFVAILAILIVFGLLLCPKVEASEKQAWKVEAGTLQGLGNGGEHFHSYDVLVEDPELPLFMGLIVPNLAWHRSILINGEELHLTRLDYDLGVSKSFFGSAFMRNSKHLFEVEVEEDEDGHLERERGYNYNSDWYWGFRYKPNHWNVEALTKVELSAWMAENSFALGADLDWEFQPGYGLEIHGIYLSNYEQKTGDNGSYEVDRLIGDVLFWHNVYPEGHLRIKAGYSNWTGSGTWLIGLWAGL